MKLLFRLYGYLRCGLICQPSLSLLLFEYEDSLFVITVCKVVASQIIRDEKFAAIITPYQISVHDALMSKFVQNFVFY